MNGENTTIRIWHEGEWKDFTSKVTFDELHYSYRQEQMRRPAGPYTFPVSIGSYDPEVFRKLFEVGQKHEVSMSFCAARGLPDIREKPANKLIARYLRRRQPYEVIHRIRLTDVSLTPQGIGIGFFKDDL